MASCKAACAGSDPWGVLPWGSRRPRQPSQRSAGPHFVHLPSTRARPQVRTGPPPRQAQPCATGGPGTAWPRVSRPPPAPLPPPLRRGRGGCSVLSPAAAFCDCRPLIKPCTTSWRRSGNQPGTPEATLPGLRAALPRPGCRPGELAFGGDAQGRKGHDDPLRSPRCVPTPHKGGPQAESGRWWPGSV